MRIIFYNPDYEKQWKEFLKRYEPASDASYFEWKYKRPCGNIQSSLMLLQEADRVVGCLSSLGDHALICGEMTTIRSLVDYYVGQEHRQKGYGFKLLCDYLSRFANDVFVAFGPNPQSGPIFKMLGWRPVTDVFKRYYFPFDIPYAVNTRTRFRISTKVQLLIKPLLRIYVQLRKMAAKGEKTFKVYEDIDSFFLDRRVYQLWAERTRKVNIDFVSSITKEHFEIYRAGIEGSKVLFLTVFNKKEEPISACVVCIRDGVHAEIAEYAGDLGCLKYLFLIALDTVMQNYGKILAITTSTAEHEKILESLLFQRGANITAYFYSRDLVLREKLGQLKSFLVSSGISDWR
jgi:hypothetical protein